MIKIDDAIAAETVDKVKAVLVMTHGTEHAAAARWLLSEIAMVLGCHDIAPVAGLVRRGDAWVDPSKKIDPAG